MLSRSDIGVHCCTISRPFCALKRIIVTVPAQQLSSARAHKVRTHVARLGSAESLLHKAGREQGGKEPAGLLPWQERKWSEEIT